MYDQRCLLEKELCKKYNIKLKGRNYDDFVFNTHDDGKYTYKNSLSTNLVDDFKEEPTIEHNNIV